MNRARRRAHLKRFVYIVSGFGGRLNISAAFEDFAAHLTGIIGRNLTNVLFVALVSHQDDWQILHLVGFDFEYFPIDRDQLFQALLGCYTEHEHERMAFGDVEALHGGKLM